MSFMSECSQASQKEDGFVPTHLDEKYRLVENLSSYQYCALNELYYFPQPGSTTPARAWPGRGTRRLPSRARPSSRQRQARRRPAGL